MTLGTCYPRFLKLNGTRAGLEQVVTTMGTPLWTEIARSSSMRAGIALVLLVSVASVGVMGKGKFVGAPKITTAGNKLTVTGALDSLGAASTVHVAALGMARCTAAGVPPVLVKTTASGDFTAQAGAASFTLTLEAAFDPPCTAPKTAEWVGALAQVSLSITANDGTSLRFP